MSLDEDDDFYNGCFVGAIDPTNPRALEDWPNCKIPDCEWKCCTWSGTVYCAIHAKELLGEEEVIRRYDATHEFTWAEMERRKAARG